MNQEPEFRPDGYWGMRQSYTKKEQDRIDFVRRNYELAMEAGDEKATNHWQEQLIRGKERLVASQKEFDEKTANRIWPGEENFPTQKQQKGLRELRIAMAEDGDEGGPKPKPSSKPVITGAGFRKPKGGGAPVKVSDAVLKANAEAAKAKVAADRAALGATDKPKLAADGLDLIRQAKEKRFGRVEPSNVPPKSNTANIIPRQEAIDEARALEEAAKEKAFADRQAFEERQLERAASKKLLEERRADAAKLKEAKRAAAAEKKAMIAAGEPLDPNMSSKPTKPPKTIPPATAAQVLGGTEGPALAQPIPDVEADFDDTPEARAARLEEDRQADNRAAYERLKNEKATLAAEKEAKKLLKAEELAKKQSSMIDYNGKPTHPSNLSALELDRLLEERSPIKGKDFGVRFDTRKLNEDNPKHMAWKKHVQELLALEAEKKSRTERAATQTEVNAAKPPKISERQSEQLRIIQAAKDEAARRNAPAPRLAPAEQLGTPPPAPTATPVVDVDPAVAERAARRAAALAELAALDAAEAPRLATPTETVTTPEGLKITRPAAPAPPAGLTPEQLASLAEADAWEAARKAKPEKGRTAPVAPPAANPPRQTPPAGTGQGGALGGGIGPGGGGIPPSAALGFGGLVFGMSMKDLNAAMAEAGEDVAGRTASQRDPGSNNQAQREMAQKYLEKKALEQSLRPPTKRGLEPINWDGAMLFRKMQGGD